MNHVQVVLYLQTPMLTKLFAREKPMKIIQICKMPGKHNIISYISENDFINFFVVSKSMNYLRNVLDSIKKSLTPANIPTKIEMNILPGGGGNAIYVPYGDVPLIRVYFLAFKSETGCLFSSLTLK